jgi:hypothetical protein
MQHDVCQIKNLFVYSSVYCDAFDGGRYKALLGFRGHYRRRGHFFL